MTLPAALGGRSPSRRRAADRTEACYERIEQREPDVQAWQWLCPDWALEQLAYHTGLGAERPLFGVPVGVKDVIDTACRLYRHLLRASGMYDGLADGSDDGCSEAAH